MSMHTYTSTCTYLGITQILMSLVIASLLNCVVARIAMHVLVLPVRRAYTVAQLYQWLLHVHMYSSLVTLLCGCMYM